MKKIYEVLKKVPLFDGIAENELDMALKCLSPQQRLYEKGEIILRAGEQVSSVGIVLSGRIQIVKEDFAGNRNILADVNQGALFAEAFSCAKVKKLPVTVISVTGSEILFIDYQKIVSSCSNTCIFHARMVENMLEILARKNIMLNQKIEHTSKRSTREKLLSYLAEQAQVQGGKRFLIPFNRQELADYLCVDRSAMSSELGRLKDEGILDFTKNEFELYN